MNYDMPLIGLTHCTACHMSPLCEMLDMSLLQVMRTSQLTDESLTFKSICCVESPNTACEYDLIFGPISFSTSLSLGWVTLWVRLFGG